VCGGCYPCDWNGEPGVCIEGVCEEDPCKGVVCNDGDLCTSDWCERTTGDCVFRPVPCRDRGCLYGSCDPDTGWCVYTPKPDDTRCCRGWGTCGIFFPERCCKVYGACEASACVAPCDPASEEVLQCPIEGSSSLICCPGSEICHYRDCPPA
jgi:hypothetical protein